MPRPARNPFEGLTDSRRVGGADALSDFLTAVALDQGDLVLALQVEPELRPVAEVAAEAHRGVCGHAAPPVQDVGDPARRHAEVEGEAVRAQATRFELALQEPSGVRDGRHVPSLCESRRSRGRRHRPCGTRNRSAKVQFTVMAHRMQAGYHAAQIRGRATEIDVRRYRPDSLPAID